MVCDGSKKLATTGLEQWFSNCVLRYNSVLKKIYMSVAKFSYKEFKIHPLKIRWLRRWCHESKKFQKHCLRTFAIHVVFMDDFFYFVIKQVLYLSKEKSFEKNVD
jgi:hypothetical protein